MFGLLVEMIYDAEDKVKWKEELEEYGKLPTISPSVGEYFTYSMTLVGS
jgi:hypothetical protein